MDFWLKTEKKTLQCWKLESTRKDIRSELISLNVFGSFSLPTGVKIFMRNSILFFICVYVPNPVYSIDPWDLKDNLRTFSCKSFLNIKLITFCLQFLFLPIINLVPIFLHKFETRWTSDRSRNLETQIFRMKNFLSTEIRTSVFQSAVKSFTCRPRQPLGMYPIPPSTPVHCTVKQDI